MVCMLRNLTWQLSKVQNNSITGHSGNIGYQVFFMKKLWSTTVIGKDIKADTMFHFHQVYICTTNHDIDIIIDHRNYLNTCEATISVVKKMLLILGLISIVSDLGTQRVNSLIYRESQYCYV